MAWVLEGSSTQIANWETALSRSNFDFNKVLNHAAPEDIKVVWTNAPGGDEGNWGYFSRSVTGFWARIQINSGISNKQQQYTILHEIGHAAASALLTASERDSIKALMVCNQHNLSSSSSESWSSGAYQHFISEAFAHWFTRVYVPTGAYDNVLASGEYGGEYYWHTLPRAKFTDYETIVNATVAGDDGEPDQPDSGGVTLTKTFQATKDASAIVEAGAQQTNKGYWSPIEEKHMPIGRFDGVAYVGRGFVYFPVDFAGMEDVVAARLYVKCRDSTGSHARLSGSNTTTITAYRMTKDWAEGNSGVEAEWRSGSNWPYTWANRAADNSNAWVTTGGAALVVARSAEYKVWDVTTIVQAWKSGSANYGFILKNSNETSGDFGQDFFDRASSTDNRAYLEVDYVNDAPPEAPTSLSPTAGALVNTLTPSITGVAVDPNEDDYISAFEIQVYDNTTGEGTTAVATSGVKTTTGTPTTFSWPVNVTLTGNTNYYWRARTRDRSNLWSPWTGETLVRATSNSGQAVLQVDSTAGFSVGDTVIINRYQGTVETKIILSLTATTMTLTTNLASTHNSGERVYALQRFKANTIPATPNSLSPATGTTVTTLTPTFSGSSIDSDPGDSLTKAQVIVYTNSSGTTVKWDSGELTASGTTFSILYAGTALAPATTYWWKARTKDTNSQFSNFTALQSFTTYEIGAPTNMSPSNSKVNTLTPTMTGTCHTATISAYDYEIKSADQSTTIYGPIVTTTASTAISFALPGAAGLAWGTKYGWRMRTKDGSAVYGPWSAVQPFWTNAAPSASQISPINSVLVSTLTPDFKSVFSDPDSANGFSDLPSEYVVEVSRNSDSVVMHTLTKSSGLTTGENSVARVAEGTALSYDVVYRWRAKFTDNSGAANAAGSYSGYQLFKPSQPPVITLFAINPADLTTDAINNPSPTFTWTFTGSNGKTQTHRYIEVIRDPGQQNEELVYPPIDTGVVATTSTTFTLPNGILQNGREYRFDLYAFDIDQLYGSASVTHEVIWSPPEDLEGISATGDVSNGVIVLSWDASTLTGSTFIKYSIYRRRADSGDSFTWLTDIHDQSISSYTDHNAGLGIMYQYKVTQWKLVGSENLESAGAVLTQTDIASDDWHFVVPDREDLSLVMHVQDEGHQDKVQEETFEPFGRSRKVVVRSGVLGAEGDLAIVIPSDERETTMTKINAIARHTGTVILKSPFGDVWEASVGPPSIRYLGAGNVTASMSWVEVG